MGGTSPRWHQFGQLATTCSQRCSHFEYRNRSCVSQFHIKFDDLFETVPLSKHNIHWQRKHTGFVQSNEPEPTEPPIPDSFYLPPAAARPNDSGSTVHQKQMEVPDPPVPVRQQELSVTSEQGFTASSEGASPMPLATSRRSTSSTSSPSLRHEHRRSEQYSTYERSRE